MNLSSSKNYIKEKRNKNKKERSVHGIRLSPFCVFIKGNINIGCTYLYSLQYLIEA
jgi:hypothetical protein